MKSTLPFCAISIYLLASISVYASAAVINHSCTTLADIPSTWVEKAKTDLHIAYGHTSHGSQLTTGMTGLVSFKSSLYAYNSGGAGGALDLRENFSGASDLGNPDFTAWATATRNYLTAHPEINVIIWSWCGQVSSATQANITMYLDLMDELESDYPNVMFVYMTGHLDGTGVTGTLHQRNEQIRAYCLANNKWLYDFADIESYDPDNNYFLDKSANDACDYDSDSNGSRDANWATNWQDSHTEDVDWYNCSSAHSQPLNANRKAYAAWWLWARLAGWTGSADVIEEDPDEDTTITTLDEVRAYPNPSKGQAVRITFSNLTNQAKISIYDVSGALVYDHDKDNSATTFRWNGVNNAGETVSSGIYVYVINDPNNTDKITKGKIAIIR